MNCVCLWGQQAGDSGIRRWKQLAEALRDRLVRRCTPANHRPVRWICISVYPLVQGDIDQVDSKDPCNGRPRQTKDLASSVQCDARSLAKTLLLGTSAECGQNIVESVTPEYSVPETALHLNLHLTL